jgi:zinc transporter 1/2/3
MCPSLSGRGSLPFCFVATEVMETQQQRSVNEVDLVKFKIQAMFIVAFVAFVGGVVPMKRASPSLLSLGNAFSGGVFLAAGFLHMLAESVEGFSEIKKDSVFPYAYFWCVIGILIPLFLEKVLLQQRSHEHGVPVLLESAMTSSNSSTVGPLAPNTTSVTATLSSPIASKRFLASILLVVTLSLHALIEGLALGIEDTVADATTILIAILAHKFFADLQRMFVLNSQGFALGVSLVKGNLGTRRILQFVALVSLTTPSGIALGLLLSGTFKNLLRSVLSEAITAVAAGTFIYVALFEVIQEELGNNNTEGEQHKDSKEHDHHKSAESSNVSKTKKFLMVLLGVGVMVLVSYWHQT